MKFSLLTQVRWGRATRASSVVGRLRREQANKGERRGEQGQPSKETRKQSGNEERETKKPHEIDTQENEGTIERYIYMCIYIHVVERQKGKDWSVAHQAVMACPPTMTTSSSVGKGIGR